MKVHTHTRNAWVTIPSKLRGETPRATSKRLSITHKPEELFLKRRSQSHSLDSNEEIPVEDLTLNNTDKHKEKKEKKSTASSVIIEAPATTCYYKLPRETEP